VALNPDWTVAHNNLLQTLHYDHGQTAESIYGEHVRWNEQHAKHLKPGEVNYPNVRDAERRLRIGYVSPDFRLHAVSAFFEPILENHDKSQFEIFCYSDV